MNDVASLETPPSDRARSERAASLAIAVGGLLLLASLVWANMDLLADTFWYIASGRSVLEGKPFPSPDPFSFASVRSRFVVHMPGSVVLFAWLERAFGLTAIALVATLVETVALAILWLGRNKTALSRLLVFPFLLFAVFLQRDDLCARGQVFGDLWFIVLLFVIEHLRDGERRVSWWLAPGVGLVLGAAWVNLHSSFVLAVLVPLLFAMASMVDHAATREGEGERTASVPPLLLFALAAAVGTLINPYGLALVSDVLSLAAHPTTFKQKLFRSPDFHRADVVLAFAMASLVGWGLAATPHRRRGSSLVVLAAFVAFAASGVRYVPHLVYVSLFFGARLVDARVRSATIPSWLTWLKPFGRPSLLRGVGLAAALLGMASMVHEGRKDVYAHVPRAAAELVVKRGLQENVLNEYHWGGFLLYAWMGHPRVFIDGRSYLYYNGVYEDSDTLEAVGPGARELLDVYGFRTALVERGSRLAVALESLPEWRKIYEDRLAVVLVRTR